MENETVLTFVDALELVLGQYENDTVLVDYQEVSIVQDNMGNQGAVVSNLQREVVIPDISWLSGLVLLLVVLYSFLRALGGMLKCKI